MLNRPANDIERSGPPPCVKHRTSLASVQAARDARVSALRDALEEAWPAPAKPLRRSGRSGRVVRTASRCN
ncbi:hypothetical protein PCL1606_29610 [Pseudomonas chlororaphis]|uniref:Uncharacterized protein n=1 Tax=Pseudomonas chlororaphis TaxID=587753 RepID=A0A0D5Y086_9PSED|nr:hypothetical protein PCL1606_29610 [Pseudomonas chlororaphis]